MKKLLLLVLIMLFAGCSTDANIASHNLSKAAEMFQLDRKIIFYDAIQGVTLLSIEGRCSIESNATKASVTCKTSETEYKKHYLGISDNVTWFAEQLGSAKVNVYRYKVIFKPESILPDVDLSTSFTDKAGKQQ